MGKGQSSSHMAETRGQEEGDGPWTCWRAASREGPELMAGVEGGRPAAGKPECKARVARERGTIAVTGGVPVRGGGRVGTSSEWVHTGT